MSKDYRDLKPASGQKPHRDTRTDRERDQGRRDWWTLEGDECAKAVESALELLMKAQSDRMRQLNVSQRLYGNLGPQSASSAYTRVRQSVAATRERITYNVVQENIDTLTARVGETKPRPYFLTSGGSYKQQRKAKKLSRWVEGVFYESKVYDVGLDAFRDAAIGGDGLLHVFGRNGKVRMERVFARELWIDEVEGIYGAPRRLHWVKLVDRTELAAAMPEYRDIILDAQRETKSISNSSISDMVQVVESWSLGTENEKGEIEGGKHCITLLGGKAQLLGPVDEWRHPFFPFARCVWAKRPEGFWSQGLAEQLQGIQIELNFILQYVQKSMRLAGSFKILRQAGSKVVKEHLNNDVGVIIDYVGQPPQYITVSPIDATYLQRIPELKEDAHNLSGVSQMSSAGKKPMGLNSGVAIREMEDVESDRHRTTQRNNDNMYLDAAKMAIAIAGEMASEGKLAPVRAPGPKSFTEVDWARDISKVKADEFVMQCFPVSRLPRDPAGRLQTVQEYVQAGMMTQRQARRALDFPDLDTIESLASAQEDLITRNLDAIVDDGKYTRPEPTDDLQLSKEMVLEYIQRFRLTDLEGERLDLLRDYNAQLDDLMAAAAPPPMPGGAPGAQPTAAPMPPPQSDLLPNAPAASA